MFASTSLTEKCITPTYAPVHLAPQRNIVPTSAALSDTPILLTHTVPEIVPLMQEATKDVVPLMPVIHIPSSVIDSSSVVTTPTTPSRPFRVVKFPDWLKDFVTSKKPSASCLYPL